MAGLQCQLRPLTYTRPFSTGLSTRLSPTPLLPCRGFGLCHSSLKQPHPSLSRSHVCRLALLDQAWGTHVNAQVNEDNVYAAHYFQTELCDPGTAVQELATNIFSTSIIPYSAFLYFLTKSKKTPPLALFGFYFLLVFVFATIPAGVIGKYLHLSLHVSI